MKPEPVIIVDGKEADAPFHDFVMAGVVEDTMPTDSQPTGQQYELAWKRL